MTLKIGRLIVVYLFLAHVRVRCFVEVWGHIRPNQKCDFLMEDRYSECFSERLVPIVNKCKRALQSSNVCFTVQLKQENL